MVVSHRVLVVFGNGSMTKELQIVLEVVNKSDRVVVVMFVGI